MTLYIYNVDTDEVIYKIIGDDDAKVSAKAGEFELDEWGCTGSAFGLIETDETETIDLDND